MGAVLSMQWASCSSRAGAISMKSKVANLSGAVALMLNDKINKALGSELGVGGNASAVLITISVEPGINIERLASQLRQGQSTMVRTVQLLGRRSFIRKHPGPDRQTLGIHLRKRGYSKVAAFLDCRAEIVERAIGFAPNVLRPMFDAAIESILEQSVEQVADRGPIRRLCNEAV